MTNQPWKPPVDLQAGSSLRRYRTLALFGFAAASVLEGLHEASAGNPWERVLAAFPMAIAATMWCTVDASSRGDYYPHSLRWVTMFTWPIAVPVYLMQTRKGRGALLTLLGLVGMIGLQVLGYFLGRLFLREIR